jgi:hypothetical protein
MGKVVTFGTSLREDQVQALDNIASEKQVSRSIVLCWAVDVYLKSLFLPLSNLKDTSVTREEQNAEPVSI